MATYYSPTAFAAHLNRMATTVQKNAQVRLDAQAIVAAQRYHYVAYKLLSGHVSSAQLAALGHPYGRGGANLPVLSFTKKRGAVSRYKTMAVTSLLPINLQTGALRKSLKVYIRRVGNKRQIWLQDAASYASFQLDPFNQGTSKMRPRRFWKTMLALGRDRGIKI